MNTAPERYRMSYVSAPAGAGKTHAVCEHIKEHQAERNHLYVAPTQILIKETAEQLRDFGVEPTIISLEQTDNVTSSIVGHLNKCKPKGQVLLITFSAFMKIRKIPRRENWDVIIDETPQVDQVHYLDAHQYPEPLMANVKVGDAINDFVLPVKVKNRKKLQELLKTPDDTTSKFSEFFRDMLNPNTDVFVYKKSWGKFISRIVTKEKDSNRIDFVFLLKPQIFNGVTLLGANIEQSMFYDWFSRYHQVEWTPNEEILEKLRYRKHPPNTASRVRINYLLPTQRYSKYMRDETMQDGSKRGEKMDALVEQHFDGKEFLFVVNKDYKGRLKNLTNATQMPVVAHGVNEHSEHTNIYFGAALNRRPQHQSVLRHLGFDEQTIRDSTVNECAYQAITRTALRNPHSKEIVDVLVPDRQTAEKLAEILGTDQIKCIGGDMFKAVEKLTPIEKNQRSRFFNRQKSVLPTKKDSENLIAGEDESSDTGEFTRTSYLSLINTKDKSNVHGEKPEIQVQIQVQVQKDIATRKAGCGEATQHFSVLFHKDPADRHESNFHVEEVNLQKFIHQLREDAKTKINSPDELHLFNPTVFQLTDKTDYRLAANFESSSFMVLDFDNGELSIDDFKRIFGSDAGKNRCSFIIWNSFSRIQSHPNRFRVLLLYKQPATSLEEHQGVYDSILTRLVENNFDETTAKLNRDSRSGVLSVPVPCTNRNYPDAAHFEHFDTKTKDIKRYGIDPSTFLKTTVKRTEKAQLSIVKTGPKTCTAEEASAVIGQYKDDVRGLPEDDISLSTTAL